MSKMAYIFLGENDGLIKSLLHGIIKFKYQIKQFM